MTKKTIILSGLVLLKFALQYLVISPEYDLHRDEFLHLDQGNHLAWGYESVAPFTSWISFIIKLLGNAVFWVKFFPALFGVLTMIVVWKAIEELKGNLFALILGAVAILFSGIMRINILYQPNSFDILCWTMFYFSILKFINSENNKWLWIASITFAFGFLNKYNIAFLLLGLFPTLIITEHRKIFKNKHFYYSMVIALLIITPNLMWQYQNNFPVIHHMRDLAETQLVNVNRADFLKEQILFFVGSLFIIVASFISFFVYKPFKHYQIFFWSFVFTLLIFIYFKAKGYYAIGLYPIYFAFGSAYLEKILSNGWKFYLRPVAILIPVLLFIPFLKVAFPILSPEEIKQKAQLYKKFNLLRWEDGKDHVLPQDFADMLGWHELAHKVDSVFDNIADKEHTLVLCDNYGEAGAINYYSRHKNVQAVSFNADYINWFNLNKREIKNIILVKESIDTDKNREKEKPLFKTISIASKVENIYAREQGTSVYVLKDAKTSINKILQKEIDKRKVSDNN